MEYLKKVFKRRVEEDIDYIEQDMDNDDFARAKEDTDILLSDILRYLQKPEENKG